MDIPDTKELAALYQQAKEAGDPYVQGLAEDLLRQAIELKGAISRFYAAEGGIASALNRPDAAGA